MKFVEFEGLTFEDTEFGSHYKRGSKRIVSENVRNAIIKRVREFV